MEKNGSNQVKRILDILKGKGVIFVIIITIIFTVIGYVYSYYYVVPKYQASETLLLIPNATNDNQTITSTDLTLNSELLSTYSNIAKQSRVLKQVIENLNLEMTEKELLSKLQINSTAGTYIIEVVVSDTNPQRSVAIAKELSSVFLDEIKQIYNLENIGIVDEAELPNNPYNINHIKDMIVFFMAGLFISSIVIIGIYLLDDTVKTEEEIEEYVGLKTLGKVPTGQKKEEIITKHNAKSYIAECINTIRTNILYMNSAKAAKTILITSCNAQDGKSFISANIATSFSETNKKVLIIDADLRKGRTEKIFNVSNEDGLSNYLYFMKGNDKEDLELAKTYIKETDIANLHILTKGSIPPNPSELLNSNNMKRLLNLLKNVYDVIIIDSPPCKVVTDSVILSTIADSVILVLNSGKTKMKEIIDAKKSIKMVGGNLIGVVLNKIKVKGKTYSKNYYYGHAKQEDKCEEIQKKSYTVSTLIDEAIKRSEIIQLPEHITEKQEEIHLNENENNTNDYKKIEEYIESQNKYLDRITSAIVEVKMQLNQNEEEKLNYKNEINSISAKINNINYKDEIEKISQNLDNVKENFINISNEMKADERILQIYNEIARIKDNYVQMLNEIRDTSYTDLLIEEINKEKLTKQEVEDIIKQEVLNRDEVEEIVKSEVLTKQQVEEIIKSEVLNKQEVEEIIKSEVLTKQEVQEIIKQEMLNREEIEEIVKQQIVLNIDYTKQFEQINSEVAELKNSYLELSNKLNLEKQEELRNEDTEKIININKFIKERRKNKKTYSIHENIPYDELEKMAVCVIPFKNNFYDDYGEKIAIK